MSMPAVGLLEVRGLGAHRTRRGRQRQWVFIGHKLSPLREQNVSSVFEWDGRMAQRVDRQRGWRNPVPSTFHYVFVTRRREPEYFAAQHGSQAGTTIMPVRYYASAIQTGELQCR